MQVDSSARIFQLPQSRSSDNQSSIADKTGNPLPPGNQETDVAISERGRSALEREKQNIANARENQEFVDFRGHDGQIRLGLWAIGEASMDSWSEKGLEITEESVLAAAEAFQAATRKMQEKHGSETAGAGIALNRHQIILNSQPVPDWFVEEHAAMLSSLDNGALKNAFEHGDTFFVTPPSASSSEALSRYADVKTSI